MQAQLTPEWLIFKDNKLSEIIKFSSPNYLSPPSKGLDVVNMQKVWLATLAKYIENYRQLLPQAEVISLAFPGPVTLNKDIIMSKKLWGNKRNIIIN